MSFIQTYFKYKSSYHTYLGKAFVNYFWPNTVLCKNQEKLRNTIDDDEAKKIIVSCYNDINQDFDGGIYEETRNKK